MRKESTTIQKCNSRLTALGLNSDAAFHRSKLILKIYRDVVWVLSERAEELQETAILKILHQILNCKPLKKKFAALFKIKC